VRGLNEFVATAADAVGGIEMLGFLTLLVAAVVAVLWYFWPRWLPRHWGLRWRTNGDRGTRGARRRFRLGALRWRWRLRWRRRRRRHGESPQDLPPDVLPDLPAEVLALSADQLAAAGRYAEAVRERLRAIVRDLVDRGVVPFGPGWTVTEIAFAASREQPGLADPLSGAVAVFSEIWYGLRPSSADDDHAMRVHAATVTARVTEPAVAEPAR
jgi:hypothetical protein